MNKEKIKSALQDLINRLQDAEEGYQTIAKNTSNKLLSLWLNKYATERHQMHRAIESMVLELGTVPEVESTFLGKIHRSFANMRISMVSSEKEIITVVDEVERGANILISDYDKVLANVEMPSNYLKKLKSQQTQIVSELSELQDLREKIMAAQVS